MTTADSKRRAPASSDRRARKAAKSASASVGSGPGSGSASLRCPPERSASPCTRNPDTAKNGTLKTAAYHMASHQERQAMDPETMPAEATAAAPVPAVVADPLAEGVVLGNPDALAARLESLGKARELFVDWLFNRLVAGIDYMVIHRKVGPRNAKTPCPNATSATGSACPTCGGKATLCKPGSEKICGLLQLRPRFNRDVDAWDVLGGEAGLVTLICERVTPAGVVVAEGRGARHRDQDYGDVNKCLKMAQKSAQTDAVLRCAGLSEILTQDLEDMPAFLRDADPAEAAPFEAPKRQSPPTPAPAAEENLEFKLRASVEAAAARKPAAAAPARPAGDEPAPSDALSKPRIGRLMALLHEAVEHGGVPDDAHDEVFKRALDWLTSWVATTQGRPKVTHCSYKAYDQLCAQIPEAVDAAIQGERRPHPRLVVRRSYAAPRRPLRPLR